MSYLLNLLYLMALVILSPWLLYRAVKTGRYRQGLGMKLFGMAPILSDSRPVVWFHGVSVGEIHLLRHVVAAFRARHPQWQCAISTTTDTGMDEAKKHFSDMPIFYFPFDFSWAVRHALRRIHPSLIVLGESEIWPNFLLCARRQHCPVVVMNARMSPRSLRRYQRLRLLTRPLWNCITLFAVQSQDYADNFAKLGVEVEKLVVTGMVKYDGVKVQQWQSQSDKLRRLLAIGDHEVIWIAGSTQAPEEEIALNVYERLKRSHTSLRLILVPRQKDRFEEVAKLLQRRGINFVRRSDLREPGTLETDAVVLVDTIGELGALWGLADLAFVGGSLDGKRGGQNMIEPSAWGSAVLFGPHVWNFREPSRLLLEHQAAVQVQDERELMDALEMLLQHPEKRGQMGRIAQQLVQQQQGATDRTMDAIEKVLALRPMASAA